MFMKKFLVLPLLLFLLLPLATAQVEPKLVGSSQVSLQLNWDVDFNGEFPQSASFTSFSFVNTSTQSVEFTTSQPFAESLDSFGNKLLTFELDSSKQTQRVSINALINAGSENGFDEVNENLAPYLEQSRYAPITSQISTPRR